MTELDAHQVMFVRSGTSLWRSMFDGVVILGPLAERPVLVTKPGLTIWQMLTDPITQREIVNRLVSVYAATPETVDADVGDVLSRLEAIGAISRGTSPARRNR